MCPGCESLDLMPDGSPQLLVCESCGKRCERYTDQCQQCGARGTTVAELVSFPAPGQSPKEAPIRTERRCDVCGYRSR